MIRQNRVAIAVAAGLVAVLALVVWTSNTAVPRGTTVAQTERVDAGAQQYEAPLAPATSEAAGGEDAAGEDAAGEDAAGEDAVGGDAASAPEAQAAPSGPKITLVGKSVPRMGDVVQDGDGRTLYRFDKDTADPAKSNCEGQCAVTWPPLLTNGSEPALRGVDPALVSTVKRADGAEQVTLDGWPLYTYAKDEAPGQWKGQGVGGTWFVVQPNGKRNVECLPPGVTAPAA